MLLQCPPTMGTSPGGKTRPFAPATAIRNPVLHPVLPVKIRTKTPSTQSLGIRLLL